MDNYLFVLFQYLVPKKLISDLIGFFAKSENYYIKTFFIKNFQKAYDVNLKEAVQADVTLYSSFNSFFTRPLKPESRPIDKNIKSVVSPADGVISQIGNINSGKIIQAKGVYFNFLSFIGNNKEYIGKFKEGSFSTIYLSPKDYHRVHIPIDGKLSQMVYIPGKLFSVNKITTRTVKNLYSINERLVCFFDTVLGPMLVVLVGAMIVSGISVKWEKENCFNQEKIQKFVYPSIGKDSVFLKKGEEIGRFMLGSTVVICFGKNKVNWSNNVSINSKVKMGQPIGTF
ncbi:MAG: phosphatidylserine decarboxylase [Candidatus Marinimicrobia bacterium]|nr:phosphatidylserine decarboxylase [Candidatus Neomarinimicrobiota bacterium]